MVGEEAKGCFDTMSALGLWDKIGRLFTSPRVFFLLVSKEKGIWSALLLYAVVRTFTFTVGVFPLLFYPMSLSGAGDDSITVFVTLGIFALLFLFGIAMTFAYSGLMHLLILAFRGKGTFADTYNVYTYSMVPFGILALIPLVGFLSIFYSLVLMVIGVATLHKVSKMKAVIACATPAILLLVSMVGLILLLGTITLKE